MVLNNFIILFSSYILCLVSVLGYGLFFNKIFLAEKIKIDIAFSGLLGIFFLTIYSYLSHFFFSHNILHNSIILMLGNFLFFYLIRKTNNINQLKVISLIFLLLTILLFSFKTHDDFPYYHFPYTNYLTHSDIIIGVGNYDHGWRTPSSIFYINSLFYLPFVKYYSYHLGAIIIMGLSMSTIMIGLIKQIKKNEINEIFYLRLLSFTFITIFFYRISEHGTDRSALILTFVLLIEIFEFFKKKQKFENFLNKLFVLGSLMISLKVFYLVYLLLLIPIVNYLYKENKLQKLKLIYKNLFFYFSFLLVTFVLIINFFNSGCLIYPLAITCFENFSWSIPYDEVIKMSIHYENWSKAGAGPNFEFKVDNFEEHIKNLNWLSIWVDKYFFNKVSDFLLGLVLMSVVFITFFYSKKKKKYKNFNYSILYFILLILLLEWFYNHPTLRYGGYSIIALIFFLPLSQYLTKFKMSKRALLERIMVLLSIVIVIFLYRNIDRINHEVKKYEYKPFLNTFYYIDDHHFRVEKEFNNFIKIYEECINKENECEGFEDLTTNKKFGKIILLN